MREPFRDPVIADGECTRYRGTVGGRPAGGGTSRVEHDGDRAYRHRIDFTFLDEATMSVAMGFRRREGWLLAESYRAESFHGERPVSSEEGRFRGVRGVQFGGTLEPFPMDLAPLLGCAVALRGLEFRAGARRTISLWLAFHVHWPLDVRVERREQVRVPAGSFDAWRVRVRPSFAQIAGPLDRLVGAVLPPFVLHFDAEPSHRLLRFSFPSGPFPWNPRALVEATELDAGQ